MKIRIEGHFGYAALRQLSFPVVVDAIMCEDFQHGTGMWSVPYEVMSKLRGWQYSPSDVHSDGVYFFFDHEVTVVNPQDAYDFVGQQLARQAEEALIRAEKPSKEVEEFARYVMCDVASAATVLQNIREAEHNRQYRKARLSFLIEELGDNIYELALSNYFGTDDWDELTNKIKDLRAEIASLIEEGV